MSRLMKNALVFPAVMNPLVTKKMSTPKFPVEGNG
jgi:hypothetical protein